MGGESPTHRSQPNDVPDDALFQVNDQQPVPLARTCIE